MPHNGHFSCGFPLQVDTHNKHTNNHPHNYTHTHHKISGLSYTYKDESLNRTIHLVASCKKASSQTGYMSTHTAVLFKQPREEYSMPRSATETTFLMPTAATASTCSPLQYQHKHPLPLENQVMCLERRGEEEGGGKRVYNVLFF